MSKGGEQCPARNDQRTEQTFCRHYHKISKQLLNELWNFTIHTHAHCTILLLTVNNRLIFDWLPNMTLCGLARDTVLSNRLTGKLNFDTN